MIDCGISIGLLIFELFLEITDSSLQALVVFLQLQLVRFQFNILRDHLFDAFLRPLVQSFIEEMNSHLQIEVLFR